MWCINDIVSSMDPSGAPILQDAETQQSLIDQITLLINQQ
nr:hypothetical protein [uncultured bacterium]